MNKLADLGLWAALTSLRLAQNIVQKNQKIKPFAKNAILLGINRGIAVIEVLRDNDPEDERQVKAALIQSVNQEEFDFLFDAAIQRATQGIQDSSLQLAAVHLFLNGKGALKLLADENPDNAAQLRAFLSAYWKSDAATDDILLALDGFLAKVAVKNPDLAGILDTLIRAILSELKP